MTYIYHEFRPKGWLYGLYGVGSAGAVCPRTAEVLKVAFYRKLCVAGTTLLGAGAQGKTMSLRELVEATLHGRDERLVAKCNVPAILQVFER